MKLPCIPLLALGSLVACEINLDPGGSGGESGATSGAPDTTSAEGTTEAADGSTGGGAMPGAASCDEVDRGAEARALPIEGPEVMLSGVYRVSGRQIYDAGQVVSVAPGTVFLMEADASLYFGWRGDPATVRAEGTAEAPILFCGTEAGAGHWVDLQLLTGTTTDSVLAHVRIEDAGRTDAPALMLTVDATLDHVEVVGNAGPGFMLSGLGAGSAALVSTENAGVSGQLEGQSAINNLPAGTYDGNGEDVLLVDQLSNTNAVFHDHGVPYRQVEERVVFGRADGEETSLTLEAGVEYQFCQDCFMEVGWRGDPAFIDVQGTEEAPVVLTSSQGQPQPGDWDGVWLRTGTRSNSRIEHARFEYGGKADGANLIVGGGLGTIVSSRFAFSAGWGVLIEGEREPGLVLEGLSFEDNGLGDVSDQ